VLPPFSRGRGVIQVPRSANPRIVPREREPPAEPDMPSNWEFVFAAYGIWAFVLALYVLWLVRRTRALKRQLDQWRERRPDGGSR
jgi:heme exporter protein CcmD